MLWLVLSNLSLKDKVYLKVTLKTFLKLTSNVLLTSEIEQLNNMFDDS